MPVANLLRLPRLDSFTDITPQSKPTTTFQIWWANIATAIEASINGIQLALDAAGIAQAAADNANAAAAAAMAATDTVTRDQALINSYIEPSSVLTSDPTTISIAAHTRYYADGTSAAVSGGSIPATGPADIDYVYYDDPARAGGPVTYQVSTTAPTQIGDTHVVGAVTVPTVGTTNGGDGPRRPGEVIP